jgi:hypothetical protein
MKRQVVTKKNTKGYIKISCIKENMDNIYTCDRKAPKQMAIATSKFNYA